MSHVSIRITARLVLLAALVAITTPRFLALVQRPSILALSSPFSKLNPGAMAKRGAASSIGQSAKKGKSKSADAEESGVVTIGGAVHSCGGQRLDSLAATNADSFYKALEPSCCLERGRVLTTATEPKRDDATCVLYWMSRDQVHSIVARIK